LRVRLRDLVRVAGQLCGCTLKGGVSADAKANTVTINLVAPDPEFKYKLAVPHASILPASAPPSDAGTKPIPGTGPYYFASYNPTKQLVLKRTPGRRRSRRRNRRTSGSSP
jgi:hypothetical protein